MWKSYKAFTKRSDRLELYLLCPAICICCYAMYLWDMAGDLAEHWARLSSLGEDSMYFILHVFPKELGVFMSLVWENSSFEEKLSASLKMKKQFKSFLGKEFKLGSFLENRNRLTPIIVNTKEGYIYWMNYPDNPQKGILLVFWK